MKQPRREERLKGRFIAAQSCLTLFKGLGKMKSATQRKSGNSAMDFRSNKATFFAPEVDLLTYVTAAGLHMPKSYDRLYLRFFFAEYIRLFSMVFLSLVLAYGLLNLLLVLV